jgi:acyl transferase domain-containing protein
MLLQHLRQPEGVVDSRHMLAVVAGSAVNQDGRSSSLTAPNGPSQQELLVAALADASIQTAELSSLSMHGTGTPLGDPIELGALTAVLGTHFPPAAPPLCLASSKSSFGHAEPAAGIVGLAHALLSQQQQVNLAIVHLKTLNPLCENVIDAAALGSKALLIPRQAGPACQLAEDQVAKTGISAFAFQVSH